MTHSDAEYHLDRDGILTWLRVEEDDDLERLWEAADETRRLNVGEEVHLRGLIEVSNMCVRSCAYCGIAACAPKVERYRMSQEDILECADKALEYGFGTVVMQAGEDPGITGEWMADTIEPGARPERTAICCASRPRTLISIAASIPVFPAESRTASTS